MDNVRALVSCSNRLYRQPSPPPLQLTMRHIGTAITLRYISHGPQIPVVEPSSVISRRRGGSSGSWRGRVGNFESELFTLAMKWDKKVELRVRFQNLIDFWWIDETDLLLSTSSPIGIWYESLMSFFPPLKRSKLSSACLLPPCSLMQPQQFKSQLHSWRKCISDSWKSLLQRVCSVFPRDTTRAVPAEAVKIKPYWKRQWIKMKEENSSPTRRKEKKVEVHYIHITGLSCRNRGQCMSISAPYNSLPN